MKISGILQPWLFTSVPYRSYFNVYYLVEFLSFRPTQHKLRIAFFLFLRDLRLTKIKLGWYLCQRGTIIDFLRSTELEFFVGTKERAALAALKSTHQGDCSMLRCAMYCIIAQSPFLPPKLLCMRALWLAQACPFQKKGHKKGHDQTRLDIFLVVSNQERTRKGREFDRSNVNAPLLASELVHNTRPTFFPKTTPAIVATTNRNNMSRSTAVSSSIFDRILTSHQFWVPICVYERRKLWEGWTGVGGHGTLLWDKEFGHVILIVALSKLPKLFFLG